MDKEITPGSEAPNGGEAENAPGGADFDSLVGKEQPVNKIEGSPAQSPAGEQPDKKPGAEGQKPAAQPAAASGDKKGEGDAKPFWGKFKTEDEAKTAYEQAEQKITTQGQELAEIKKEQEKIQPFLTALDKALAAKPELAEQLRAALAAVAGEAGQEGAGKDSDKPLTRADAEQLFEERETKAKTKAEIDAWLKDHDKELKADGEKLGIAILDRIKENRIPFTAQNLQLVYDALTGDRKAVKAAEDALKKEEIADLDREGASAVGGGSPASKGKTPQGAFDELVGGRGNPNRL